MKRLLLTLFISLSVLIAGAQKIYFVYIQTENQQPFYVKLNDKTYSSSATGYVILSRLRDTSFNISVGFPQNKWPEQKFSIEMRGKDHGYLLKNFDDGSWGLFDLQTTSLQVAPVQPKTGKTGTMGVSHFTQVLAKASNDPSLLEKPIPVKQEEKPAVVSQPKVLSETETVKNPPAIQKTAANKESEVVAIKKEPTLPKPEDYKKSVVTKKFETSTSEGFGLVFIDEYANGKKDTISIIIPELKEKAAKETLKEEKKFLDFETKVSGAQRLPFKVFIDKNCEAASKDDYYINGFKAMLK